MPNLKLVLSPDRRKRKPLETVSKHNKKNQILHFVKIKRLLVYTKIQNQFEIFILITSC